MDNNSPFYIQRRKIITDHLDKFPDAGSLTIAKIIFRDYKEYFNTVEDIRFMIRYRRGVTGKVRLSHLMDKKYVKQI
jgi:hypothetical protein